MIRFTLAFLLACRLLTASSGLRAQAPKDDAQSPSDRVTHYAFVSTGDSMRPVLRPIYWAVNKRIQECLSEYGYPDEAVYCFCEEGAGKAPTVDGKATAANFKKTFAHLAKIMQKNDHLTIFLIGHGSPRKGDVVHPLCDRMITATEFKEMLDPLPTQNLTIIINTCHSGGFIDKLKGPGRVICTCTTDKEVNGAKWPEHLAVALFPLGTKPDVNFPHSPKIDFSGTVIDANGDGRISIKEAYNAALLSGKKLYGDKLREHPLLEDNGDGIGHFGPADVVEGDGELAARRFLGDEGRRLRFSPAAIEKLKTSNATLKLE